MWRSLDRWDFGVGYTLCCQVFISELEICAICQLIVNCNRRSKASYFILDNRTSCKCTLEPILVICGLYRVKTIFGLKLEIILGFWWIDVLEPTFVLEGDIPSAHGITCCNSSEVCSLRSINGVYFHHYSRIQLSCVSGRDLCDVKCIVRVRNCRSCCQNPSSGYCWLCTICIKGAIWCYLCLCLVVQVEKARFSMSFQAICVFTEDIVINWAAIFKHVCFYCISYEFFWDKCGSIERKPGWVYGLSIVFWVLIVLFKLIIVFGNFEFSGVIDGYFL